MVDTGPKKNIVDFCPEEIIAVLQKLRTVCEKYSALGKNSDYQGYRAWHDYWDQSNGSSRPIGTIHPLVDLRHGLRSELYRSRLKRDQNDDRSRSILEEIESGAVQDSLSGFHYILTTIYNADFYSVTENGEAQLMVRGGIKSLSDDKRYPTEVDLSIESLLIIHRDETLKAINARLPAIETDKVPELATDAAFMQELNPKAITKTLKKAYLELTQSEEVADSAAKAAKEEEMAGRPERNAALFEDLLRARRSQTRESQRS